MHCFLSYPKWISNLLLTNYFQIGYIQITISTTFSLLLTLVMSFFELVYILRNEFKLALTTSFGCSENSLILEPRCNRIWVLILKFFALTELFTLLLSYLFLSRLRNRFLNQIKSIQHFFFFLGWLDWFFDFGLFEGFTEQIKILTSVYQSTKVISGPSASGGGGGWFSYFWIYRTTYTHT